MKVARKDERSDEVETSLIVPVDAAMAQVEPWRRRLDPFSARGMQTHITVEYPFLPVAEIDDDVVSTLEELFGAVAVFPFRLTSVEWFDDRVIWLAPEPDDAFRGMTAAVIDHWPELRPYGGPPGLVPPHLTIGVSEPRERLEEAGLALEPLLPIECVAEEVWLMSGTTSAGSWRVDARFPLRTERSAST